jgi:GT2 family glycosyltransferase
VISVILVQYNNGSLTLDAVKTLREHASGTYEILVVDNASTDGSFDQVRRGLKDVTLIANPSNAGFGAANDLAARRAVGDILLFLNNDTLSHEDIIAPAEAEFARDASLGVLGPALKNPDGTFQLSAGWLPSFWREIVEKCLYAGLRAGIPLLEALVSLRFRTERTVGWVTGAALYIRKDLYETIGRFDPSMFMYFEDKDICARVWKAGKQVVYAPSISLTHIKGGSSREQIGPNLKSIYRESQLRYYERHRPRAERSLVSAYQWLTRSGPRD